MDESEFVRPAGSTLQEPDRRTAAIGRRSRHARPVLELRVSKQRRGVRVVLGRVGFLRLRDVLAIEVLA